MIKRTFTLAIFICSFYTALFAGNIKIEPSCWWIGMDKPDVQLMVSAKGIGELTPSINYPGVKITGVTQVENRDYIFIDISIDNATALPGKFQINFNRNKITVSSCPYELFARKKNSTARASFTPEDVIYLITPDRFSNGDAANDNATGLTEGVNRADENGRHGGDIKGITNHVKYISDMGFSTIWLTPVLENSMPTYSYHGYSITDFYNIDPRMGTNAQYKEMCEKAAQYGVKVVMDMVFNHCGNGHPWMKSPPASDWITFKDSPVYTNHRKTVFQDTHVAPPDHRQMVDGWFSKTMPHLNQRNPLLANYLINNTKWWIEYAGLSGIRVDTYPYPDMDFMARWTKEITQAYPNLNIVGEIWSENPATIAYWQKGKLNHNGYTSYLPSLMDFPVQAALVKALNEKNNTNGFISLYETIANDFQYANADNMVIFADNHDIPRFYSLLNEDTGLFKLGMAFILTTRGIPQLLYGTEILQTGVSHGKLRSDLPGGWPGDVTNAFTGAGLADKQTDTKNFIQKILLWRKNAPSLPNSKLMHYVPREDVYVYFRYNDKGKTMVVLNKNASDKTIDLSRFADMIGAATTGKNILTGNDISLTGTLTAPGKNPLIIEWQTNK